MLGISRQEGIPTWGVLWCAHKMGHGRCQIVHPVAETGAVKVDGAGLAVPEEQVGIETHVGVDQAIDLRPHAPGIDQMAELAGHGLKGLDPARRQKLPGFAGRQADLGVVPEQAIPVIMAFGGSGWELLLPPLGKAVHARH